MSAPTAIATEDSMSDDVFETETETNLRASSADPRDPRSGRPTPSPTGYRGYTPDPQLLTPVRQPEPDIAHKTILLGDSGVGKTSLLVQFDTGKFQAGSFSATVGIGFTGLCALGSCMNFTMIAKKLEKLASGQQHDCEYTHQEAQEMHDHVANRVFATVLLTFSKGVIRDSRVTGIIRFVDERKLCAIPTWPSIFSSSPSPTNCQASAISTHAIVSMDINSFPLSDWGWCSFWTMPLGHSNIVVISELKIAAGLTWGVSLGYNEYRSI